MTPLSHTARAFYIKECHFRDFRHFMKFPCFVMGMKGGPVGMGKGLEGS